MVILLHTSKTMRNDACANKPVSTPVLLEAADELARYISLLSSAQLQEHMSISEHLATKTHQVFTEWSKNPSEISAVDSFVGDIYSGLQAGQWSKHDALFAQDHLRILSGLYGILKPLDDIRPYRLEMGYKLPDEPYKNLYKFWGSAIAKELSGSDPILNLTAIEYSKSVTPHMDVTRIVAPAFLTISPKTHQPTFVTVHTKIARGALANWVIKNRLTDISKITAFTDLGYCYEPKQSTPERPVFVCRKFGGLGLSVRIQKIS